MRNRPVHRCKLHGDTYTRCLACGCEYCTRTYTRCPRTAWSPAHATTDAEIGRRERRLMEARHESTRRRGHRDA